MYRFGTWPQTEAGKESYTKKAISTFTEPESASVASEKKPHFRRMPAVGAAIVAVAAPNIGLADMLNTTPREAAQNMVSDIQKHGKNVQRLNGNVVLSSSQYDTVKIRPEIGTTTFDGHPIKETIHKNESAIVKDALLVTDERDGDVKLVVRSGESDSGYGVVAVDSRTSTNIEMSGVIEQTPVDVQDLAATSDGVIVQAGLENQPIGVRMPAER